MRQDFSCCSGRLAALPAADAALCHEVARATAILAQDHELRAAFSRGSSPAGPPSTTPTRFRTTASDLHRDPRRARTHNLKGIDVDRAEAPARRLHRRESLSTLSGCEAQPSSPPS